MPVGRFYTDTSLADGTEILLGDQEYHHLVHVTRAKEGDSIDIVNGKGILAKGIVQSIRKKNALIRINAATHGEPSPLRIILAQAIPRINRLDLIVEKCTELGITELRLFPGESGERVKLSEHQLSRLAAIAVGAMKQSGRLYLPEIKIFPPLQEWQSFPGHSYFGDLSPDALTLIELWEKTPPATEAAIFIGPESGFSSEEEQCLRGHAVQGVSLHENILRTDTAAIAAVAVLSLLGKKKGT